MATDTPSDLIAQAKARKWKLIPLEHPKPGTAGLRVWVPKGAEDPALMAKINKNASSVRSLVGAPALKMRVDNARQHTMGQMVNNWANRMRDRFAGPAIGGLIEGTKRNLTFENLESVPKGTSKPYREAGQGIAEALMPNSITGKAVNAALMTNPASELGLAGRIALPTLSGYLAGDISGEGKYAGAAQGASGAAIGEMGGDIPEAGRQVSNYLRRGGITKKIFDNRVPGEYLKEILGLTKFSQWVEKKGPGWVHGLRDPEVAKEAGTRLNDGLNDLAHSVGGMAQEKARAVKDAFYQRWNVVGGKLPEKDKMSKAMLKDLEKTVDKVKGLLNTQRQVMGTVRQMRSAGKGAYNDVGALKSGQSAWNNAQDYTSMANKLRATLGSFDQGLVDTYDHLMGDYSLFAALRGLARNKQALTDDNRNANLKYFQEQMQNAPERIKGRVGQYWEGIKNTFSRMADESAGVDREGSLQRIRASLHRGGGYISGPIEGILGGPPVAKPVGNVNLPSGLSLLPKQPPIQPALKGVPTNLVRALTGSNAAGIEDLVRGYLGSGQPTKEAPNAPVP